MISNILLKREASEDYLSLIWQIFFLDKKRGITLDAHFPWLTDKCENTWFLESRDIEGVLLGGLVVKLCFSEDSIGISKVGKVGLVCVEPRYRGQGIAKKLMNALIEFSQKTGFSALTLWTSQPYIYINSGFEYSDNALFGMIEFPETEQNEPQSSFYSREKNELGIPPFATSCRVFSNDLAKVTVIYDDKGAIISDWSGNDEDVVNLMELVFKGPIRLNSSLNAPINRILKNKCLQYNLNKTELQMWKLIDNSYRLEFIQSRVKFNIFERI